jgi:histone H3/H4
VRKFEVTNNATGASLVVEGTVPPSEEEIQALFDGVQATAIQSLDSGDYKYEGRFNLLKGDEREKQAQKFISLALGVKKDEVDMSGAPFKTRLELDFLPTPQDRYNFLVNKYGEDNVKALSLDGDAKLLYRSPKETNNKFLLVDEMGLSLKDVTADIAGEALPIGAAGLAVFGAPFTAGASGLILPALYAGTAYYGTSTAQDLYFRGTSGLELDPEEVLTRRGVETVIGLPIDVATAGAGKFISKALSKKVVPKEKAVKELIKSSEELNKKYELGLDPTTGMISSEQLALKESEIAAKRPDGLLSKRLASERDKLENLVQIIKGEKPAESFGDIFAKQVDEIQTEHQTLINNVKSVDRELSDALPQYLDDRLNKIATPKSFSKENIGRSVQANVYEAFQLSKREKNRLFTEAEKLMDNTGVSIPVAEVGRAIKRGIKQLDLAEDFSGDVIEALASRVGLQNVRTVEQLTKVPGSEVGSTLSFSQLSKIIRNYQDKVPYGKQSAEWTQTQSEYAALAKTLSNLRDRVASKAPQQARRAYNDANRFYNDDYLQFVRSATAPTIALDIGSSARRPKFKATGTSVLKVLRDPGTTKEFLKSVKNNSKVREQLRLAYLNEIGLTKGTVDTINGIKFNEDIMRVLYSQKKVDSLNKINKLLKSKKEKLIDLDANELNSLLTSVSDVERNRITKLIETRINTQAKADDLIATKLISKINNNEIPAPENAADFVRSLFNKSVDIKSIKTFMEKLPNDSARQSLRQEFFGELLNQSGRASDDLAIRTSTDAGLTPIFNVKSLKKNLTGVKGDRAKAVLGGESYKDLQSLVKYAEKVAPTTDKEGLLRQRLTTTIGPDGKPSLIGVAMNIPSAIANRIMSAAYGSRVLENILRENVVIDDIFPRVFAKMLLSERGTRALLLEAQKDPEFYQFLQLELMDTPINPNTTIQEELGL